MSDVARWTETTLGQACRIVSGSTPKTSVAEYWGGDIRWITPDDLSGYSSKTIGHGKRSLTKAGYDSCSATLIPAGSVLFTSRAPIGYVAVASRELCTNQGFKSLVPGPCVLSDYLYWYLRWAAAEIRGLGSGTTFKEVSKGVVSSVRLRHPSIEEQRLIVRAIEEQFLRLDAGEALIVDARTRLRALQDAIFKTVMSKGFGEKPLRELGTWCGGGTPSKAVGSYWRKGTVPWVSPKDMKSDLIVGSKDKVTLDAIQNSAARIVPARSLLLVTRSGILAHTLPVAVTGLPVAINQDLKALVPREGVVAEFLLYVLKANEKRILNTCSKAGTTVASIEFNRLMDFRIPLPPPREQHRIVRIQQEELARVKGASTMVAEALRKSGPLRQAILSAAFSGQLPRYSPKTSSCSATGREGDTGQIASVGGVAEQNE